jgi:hypothetical protein
MSFKISKSVGARVWGALVWEQHPQIEDVVPTPPYEYGSAAAYLGAAGGDALSLRASPAGRRMLCSVALGTDIKTSACPHASAPSPAVGTHLFDRMRD